MKQNGTETLTEEMQLTKRREGVQGWLTMCALSRWFVAGEMSVADIMALRWPYISPTVARRIASGVVTPATLAALAQQTQTASRQMGILVIAASVVVTIISTLRFLRKRIPPIDALLGTHSERALHITTILSGLAFFVVMLGYSRVQQVFQQATPDSGQYLIGIATYLQRMRWVMAAGLVLVVASVVTQPFVSHWGTGKRILLFAVEACVLVLALRFGNEEVLVELALLHLAVANIMLSTALSRSGRKSEPNDDEGHMPAVTVT
jgi:hypothetical protein